MTLSGEVMANAFVKLEPLGDQHREPFRDATADDETTWTLLLRRWAGEHFDPEWQRFRREQEAGTMMPFAVIVEERCLGITAYLNPDGYNQTVEVGATWYHPSVRGGVVNPATKLLMLGHAFDSGARRVQLKVDAENARSRAAVTRLGAVQEGILRQDRVTWTGRVRDTVFFSILRDEWPAVRKRLLARLQLSRCGLDEHAISTFL